MRPEILDDIRAFTQKVGDFANTIDDVANGAVDLVFSPLEMARRLADSLGGIVQACTDVKDNVLSRMSFDWFSEAESLLTAGSDISRFLATDDLDNETITPSSSLAMQDLQRQLERETRRVRDEAETQRRAVNTPAEQILGFYRAVEGENVREVSTRYYGPPDQWRALMDYNGLDDSTLYGGQLLIIPYVDVNADEGL